MAAPPKSRGGDPGRAAGRLVVAGVGPFERPLSPRSTPADLWASLDALAVDSTGVERLENRHGTHLDGEARRRFIAYVDQAREYYLAVPEVSPVAKPLLGYYFVLNLTKALLTAIAPVSTEPDRIGHGTSPRFERKQRYRIQQESLAVSQNGVFRELATRTGMRFRYSSGHKLRVLDLLAYLPDGFDLYADSAEEAPKLLPIARCYPLFGKKQGWLRVEIDRDELKQRKIGPEDVPKRCAIFGQHFRLVQSTEPTASYESINTSVYGKSTKEAAPALCQSFDEALIATNRTLAGARRFVVVSGRPKLLSHEAVTFAVLHHLSSMVRYRPQDVERLSGSRHYWLFSSWVERACENYLLNLASRITLDEHVIR
ncbi:MAG: hypothetical protein GY788_29000 [bacterium]|nr:hypothetical protein [bacterium]